MLKAFAKEGVLTGPIARAKAADALNIQIAAGVPEKDLVSKAGDSLKATHIVAAGVPVHNSIPGVGDASVAKEYLEDAARFFKRDNAKLKDTDIPVALADDPARPGRPSLAVRFSRTMERRSREACERHGPRFSSVRRRGATRVPSDSHGGASESGVTELSAIDDNHDTKAAERPEEGEAERIRAEKRCGGVSSAAEVFAFNVAG